MVVVERGTEATVIFVTFMVLYLGDAVPHHAIPLIGCASRSASGIVHWSDVIAQKLNAIRQHLN